MYSEHLKNKKNMHVGDILGFILVVIRVKNQLKTKYFTGPFMKNDNSLFLQCKITPFLLVFFRIWTVVILWDLQFTWKMTFCHLSTYVMVLRYILDHLKLKKIDSENGNGAKLALYPKIEGKW